MSEEYVEEDIKEELAKLDHQESASSNVISGIINLKILIEQRICGW
jgi:hypothetical protein